MTVSKEEEQNEMIKKVPHEVMKDWDRRAKEIVGTAYVSIWPISSCLDGNFTSAQLRGIADLMDKVKQEIVEQGYFDELGEKEKEGGLVFAKRFDRGYRAKEDA